MFNEVVKTEDISLVFLKSLNVNVFPCGRRRSSLIESTDGDYYIPFDPEAKLNTEANNIKHSSLNGLSQTYIRYWDADRLSLVIGGYLFDIKQDLGLTADKLTVPNVLTAFGTKVLNKLGTEEGSSIYANVRIEEVPLYSGFSDYNTSVLRDQSGAAESEPSTNIDLLNTEANDILSDPSASAQKIELNRQKNIINYFYFAGLSFSTMPLTADLSNTITENATKVKNQRIVSLRILDKDGTAWKIHQPALLPKIEHGDQENSVKFDTVYVDKSVIAAEITADIIKQEDGTVPTLTLNARMNDENEKVYRLNFSKTNVINN